MQFLKTLPLLRPIKQAVGQITVCNRCNLIAQHELNHDRIMPPFDLAIPILPSQSVSDTLTFYQQLGFDGTLCGEGDSYAILTRGTVELHFFTHRELCPAESFAGCYIRVFDVESIYRAFGLANLPSRGIPRIDPLENKPWGMREFAIVDPDGNLIRIGQVLE